MKGIIKLLFVLALFVCIQSCGESEPGTTSDNFDRNALLTDLADNVIIPGYNVYGEATSDLLASINAFTDDVNVENLSSARDKYLEAYIAWQRVSMFEIGKAEAVSLRNRTNIFPTSVDGIQENIASGDYNLALPSKIDEQGFPALDYLLFGIGETEQEIILYYENNENAKTYLNDIARTLQELANEVKEDWLISYRETFISGDGSTGTSSLDKLVNDYLFYYEKFLRAGKIGIPAGIFSLTPDASKVEAPYSRENSKFLFLTGLQAVKDFFEGKSAYVDAVGESLKTYVDYLDRDNNGLSNKIIDQFDLAIAKANEMNDDLGMQVDDENLKMLETYDELQKNVVFLKVDMLQSLNIKVDFVDADGD